MKSVHESPKKKDSSYKRSGTQLLGQLKEKHSAQEGTAGVVPKDIGFGLIKDLIDLDELEEELENKAKNKKRKFKKNSTQKL